MQEHDSLYDEAHELLWGEHYTCVKWNGAELKATLKWSLNSAEIDDIVLLKGECDITDLYCINDLLEYEFKKTTEYNDFVLRIANVEKRIAEAFPTSDEEERYRMFMFYIENDFENTKIAFYQSFKQ